MSHGSKVATDQHGFRRTGFGLGDIPEHSLPALPACQDFRTPGAPGMQAGCPRHNSASLPRPPAAAGWCGAAFQAARTVTAAVPSSTQTGAPPTCAGRRHLQIPVKLGAHARDWKPAYPTVW